MKRWKHTHSLLTGAALGLAYGHSVIAVALVIALLVFALYAGWRGLRRAGDLTRAAERRLGGGRLESERRSLTESWPGKSMTDDPDYLEGVERGIRSARRSAGHEDGRLAERGLLETRPMP